MKPKDNLRSNKLNTNKISKVAGLLFIVFAIDYILLFGAETILPGFVTKVFNLNLLLAGAMMMWILAVTLGSRSEVDDSLAHHRHFRRIDFGLLIFLLIILVISLYKLALILVLLYALFGALSFWLLRKYLIGPD